METLGNAADTFELKKLLDAWRRGDEKIFSLSSQSIIRELRILAGHAMRRERADHTLQPTALVNETFLELIRAPSLTPQSKTHFFGIAANLMRQILIQYARRKTSLKRGGETIRVPFEEQLDGRVRPENEALDLHRAIKALRRLDQRQARIVELRYFQGCSVNEVARNLRISPATVKREWATAKIWLYRRLNNA